MSDSDFSLDNTQLPKFKVVGLLQNPQFQKCRYLVEKLYKCYPNEYAEPAIRGMLNLDWNLFLTKMKRRQGSPYYLLRSPVAVYQNGVLIGDNKNLMDVVSKTYQLDLNVDFQELADKELIKYFENIIKTYQRKFVFLTIAIDEHVIGSMLFMLYNDLVPATCENFLNRCTEKCPHYSYKGTKIHRIAKYSWIQCGGYNIHATQMACENYAVPHGRRGVLSMCNTTRHVDNSTQFFITLEGTPWMDYKYVAFGQLIQGSEILDFIEKVPTKHQKPSRKIEIVNCGEFSLCPALDEEYVKALHPPYNTLFDGELKYDDVDSVLSQSGLKEGKYCLKTDLTPYMPFTRYSGMFDSYLKDLSSNDIEEHKDEIIKALKKIENEPAEEEEEDDETRERSKNLFKSSVPFYRKRNKFFRFKI